MTDKSLIVSIQASLDAIKHRLDRLESASETKIPGAEINHPSLDKFAIAEAIADQIFAGAGKEKACTYEPTPRPCDHCSMCNSRGF